VIGVYGQRGHQVFRRFLSAVAMICITFYKLRNHP
jgi:hypothetical protein